MVYARIAQTGALSVTQRCVSETPNLNQRMIAYTSNKTKLIKISRLKYTNTSKGPMTAVLQVMRSNAYTTKGDPNGSIHVDAFIEHMPTSGLSELTPRADHFEAIPAGGDNGKTHAVACRGSITTRHSTGLIHVSAPTGLAHTKVNNKSIPAWGPRRYASGEPRPVHPCKSDMAAALWVAQSNGCTTEGNPIESTLEVAYNEPIPTRDSSESKLRTAHFEAIPAGGTTERTPAVACKCLVITENRAKPMPIGALAAELEYMKDGAEHRVTAKRPHRARIGLASTNTKPT